MINLPWSIPEFPDTVFPVGLSAKCGDRSHNVTLTVLVPQDPSDPLAEIISTKSRIFERARDQTWYLLFLLVLVLLSGPRAAGGPRFDPHPFKYFSRLLCCIHWMAGGSTARPDLISLSPHLPF